MSTRCHLVVKGQGFEKAYIYHHCDGYPDGVGTEIVEEMKQYDNPEWRVNEVVNKILSISDEYELDSDIHGDEDYIYLIDCDSKKIECYNADCYDDEDDCGGDELVIPGNIDFNSAIIEKKGKDESYQDTLTRITCAMIPIAPVGTDARSLVGWAKNVTDEIIKIINE